MREVMWGTSAYSRVTLAGVHLVGLRAAGTLGLPLTTYATVD